MDSNKFLTGQSEENLVPWRETKFKVHSGMRDSLEQLTQSAKADGIDLHICSAFRSFDRQVSIWNAKAAGERTLFDDAGEPLDFATLSPPKVVDRILRWSALPGTSRHHWGTDVDVYDASAVPANYKVQLTQSESFSHFSRLHRWLDDNMSRFGFFRPYARDLGGVAPEAWHLSYAPIAQAYFSAYNLSVLENAIRAAQLMHKEYVLENLPQIFERYFLRITPAESV